MLQAAGRLKRGLGAGLRAGWRATALCLAPGLLARAAWLLLLLGSTWLMLAWWGWEPATDEARRLLGRLGLLAPVQGWLLRWEQPALLTVLGPLALLLLAWPLAWLALCALLQWLWLPGLRRRCGLASGRQAGGSAGRFGPRFGPTVGPAAPRHVALSRLAAAAVLALLLACTALPLQALLWWPWRRAWLLWSVLAPAWGLGVMALLAHGLQPAGAAGAPRLRLLQRAAWPLWLAAAPLGWLALGPLSPWTAGPPALVLAPLLGLWALALQAALLMWAAAWCAQWVSAGPAAAAAVASVPMAPAPGPAP